MDAWTECTWKKCCIELYVPPNAGFTGLLNNSHAFLCGLALFDKASSCVQCPQSPVSAVSLLFSWPGLVSPLFPLCPWAAGFCVAPALLSLNRL